MVVLAQAASRQLAQADVLGHAAKKWMRVFRDGVGEIRETRTKPDARPQGQAAARTPNSSNILADRLGAAIRLTVSEIQSMGLPGGRQSRSCGSRQGRRQGWLKIGILPLPATYAFENSRNGDGPPLTIKGCVKGH